LKINEKCKALGRYCLKLNSTFVAFVNLNKTLCLLISRDFNATLLCNHVGTY